MAITQLVAIDDYLIDCSLSETHTFDSDVTDYPVESGSNITDNVRPLPIVVEMECLVSNTPIGLIKQYRNLSRNEGVDSFMSKPVDDAYELLILIREQRKPVTIRTSLRTFDNMVLKSLSIPRGAHLDELRFTATFQQIQTVENKRTVRVSTPIGKHGRTVSRPPKPSDTRQILIDPLDKAWFDPDVGLWRKKAFFVKDFYATRFVGPGDATNVATFVPAFWSLYRNDTYPVDHIPASTRRAGNSNGVGSPAWVPPLILVTLNQCKLNGFTINKTFGGLIQPFGNGGTKLTGRFTK